MGYIKLHKNEVCKFARYSYIQCTGLGTITDSLSVLKKHVFEERKFNMEQIIHATDTNFEGQEAMRQFILNRTPFFGNDDEYADRIAIQIFNDLYDAIEGKPNTKGECFHLNMLSTTCHVYFGKMMNATPNGRLAGRAISDGTSPSHGADTHGPSAVIKRRRRCRRGSEREDHGAARRQ